MGFRAHPQPSWSLSRSRLLRECPRGFFFKYYSRGEPEHEQARRLGSLTTLVLAAGQVVDYVIARTLQAYRDDGEVKDGLADIGERFLRKIIASSPAVCQALREGEPPRRDALLPPLLPHFQGQELPEHQVEQLVLRIRTCLDAFEQGEVWSMLRRVDVGGWAPISRLEMSVAPHFTAPKGIRIYAAYDFVCRDSDGIVYVYDWKSGGRGPKSELEAGEQLALYAAWAKRTYGLPLGSIRTQAVWLLEGEAPWCPQTVGPDDVYELSRRVKREVTAEEEMVEARLDQRGRVDEVWARRGTFEPRPLQKACSVCSYRTICPEGQKAAGDHLDQQE